MKRPAIDLRVFVVGVPRSGTTLVQSLLAAHSTVTSFTESHFFDRHFSLLPLHSDPVLMRNPNPRLHEFLAENDEESLDAARWFDAVGRPLLWLRPLLPFLTRSVARRFFAIVDEMALRRGVSRWVEKTPRHLRYIPFLERLSGAEARTRFVHVVRDGLEVVASLHAASQSWQRPYDLDDCIDRWNADVGFSLGRITEPADHLVVYEELTAQPENTIRRLLDGLGLSWEPEILERYGRAADRLVTDDEPWKAEIGRGIRRSQTSHRVLTPEQRARAKHLLRHDLYEQLQRRRPEIHDAG